MEGALTKASFAERKAMIDRSHELSIARQAKALRVSRALSIISPGPGED